MCVCVCVCVGVCVCVCGGGRGEEIERERRGNMDNRPPEARVIKRTIDKNRPKRLD